MNQRRFWFVNKSRLFRDLTGDDAEVLERIAEHVRFRRKQIVFDVGHIADKVYLIRSGVVKLSRPVDDNHELTLMFLAHGEIVGEAALASRSPRTYQCQAYDDLEAYAFNVREFQDFLMQRPAVALRLMDVFNQRRLRMEERLDQLLFRDAHARLACLFLELADEFAVRDGRGTIVNLRLTHREMAHLIGSTRETVSFALLDLKREGLIETDGKRVVIKDLEKLAARSGARGGRRETPAV